MRFSKKHQDPTPAPELGTPLMPSLPNAESTECLVYQIPSAKFTMPTLLNTEFTMPTLPNTEFTVILPAIGQRFYYFDSILL